MQNEEESDKDVEKLTFTIFGDEYLKSKYPDNWQEEKLRITDT